MRGALERQQPMFTSVSIDSLIADNHPIRRIRVIVDQVLAELEREFTAMYSHTGRPSVPPEQLLKATILMALYSIRSERAFCERLNYDLLFKWFLDCPLEAQAFDATTFTKNRERLLGHEIADRFFAAVVSQAKLRRYVSSEHFSVDGTLLEGWASHKSFKPKDGSGTPPEGNDRNATVDFSGKPRSNDTHASTTDPEAMLAKKARGTTAKLCYSGHLLMENRSALLVDMELTQATGRAEREAALVMLDRLPKTKGRRTVAADKAYDAAGFIEQCRTRRITTHVAQNNTKRSSAIDGRTTRHEGHAISQRVRKRVEEPFGWIKTIAGGRKLRYKGQKRNRAWFLMMGSVYNVIRIAALDAQAI